MFSMVLRAVALVSNFIFIFLFNKIYGTENFGYYSIFLSILTLSTVFSKFGFDVSVIKIISELRVKENYSEINQVIKKVILFCCGLGIIITTIIFLNQSLFLDMIDNKNYQNYFFLTILCIIPYTLIQIIAAFYQAYLKNNIFILLQFTLLPILSIFVLILFYFFKIDYQFFQFVYFCIIVGIFIFASILLKKLVSENFLKVNLIPSVNEKVNFTKIITLTAPMFIGSSLMLVTNWFDVLYLGYFVPKQEIGFYSYCVRLTSMISVGLFIINSYIAPKIALSYAKRDFIELKKLFIYSIKFCNLFAIPVFIIFILFAEYFISFSGIKNYTTYYTTTFVLLGFAQISNNIFGTIGYFVLMTKNEKLYLICCIFGFLLNIIFNVLLIPSLGIKGSAISILICNFFTNLFLFYFIYKKFNFAK